jgi:pyrroloquinoline quinone (PQQ) biosynthesis protein C
MLGALGLTLSRSQECKAVLEHPIFARIAAHGIDRRGAQRFVDQFWHPSHYFPTFLAGLISQTPRLEVMTSLSRILWQELGEGDPRRAHESIYVDTMLALGLRDPSAHEDEPNEATARLVEQYRIGASDFLTGLGCIYATEAIDLPIVSGLGVAVSAATGAETIPWVEIHAEQEPDHMESATAAVDVELDAMEADKVAEAARSMWLGWNDFYSTLELELFASASV